MGEIHLKVIACNANRFVQGISIRLGCPEWQITAFPLALLLLHLHEMLPSTHKSTDKSGALLQQRPASARMPNLLSTPAEADGIEGHLTAPCLWYYCKTLLVLMHGLAENKPILKFLFHNNAGEDNKSSQNILVIGRSFKTLHNFVKTGNLEISSFLNRDWESSEFCMPWFYYGFLNVCEQNTDTTVKR